MNTLTIEQTSAVLNDVLAQVTGSKTIGTVTPENFVSVATTVLKQDYDVTLKAISQVLSRTIFSVRPYTRKFKGMEADEIRFGNHVRKLNLSDLPFEDDQRYTLEDDVSVDMYKVRKPKVLQVNMYGQETFQTHYTVFRDQLDVAFSSMEEFGRFLAMVAQNLSDTIEQAHESLARATVANFINGKVKGDAPNVIKLVTVYNDMTGAALTPDTVKQPQNFVPFVKWMYGYISSISSLLTERTVKYHINVTDHEIARHTPASMQSLYLYSPELNNIRTSVLSDVFNPDFLKLAYTEQVNFWQSIDTPMGINNKPEYLLSDGTTKVEEEAVTTSNVFGLMCDVEAMGYTVVNQWTATTPFNAAGGYSNIYFHFTDRYWNDFTENAVVFLLE
jgi:hypothetical protein